MGKDQLSSRIGFILAAAGSAVGLGAIWKSPYIAGISGGGAFFLIFLMLFLFAALTSAFSMLEIIVSSISKGDSRKRSKWAWIIGLCIFIFGIPSNLSFGILSDVSILGKSFLMPQTF